MKTYSFLNQILRSIGTIAILLPASLSFAHHSFAPYDIRNPVEISGVAEEWVYRRPHPMLTLITEEGVSWEIEVPIRRWERAGHEPDLIKPGDELVVKAFIARNGDPSAAMSGLTKDGTYYSVTEEVRQQSGNAAADAIESGESIEEVVKRYTDADAARAALSDEERAALRAERDGEAEAATESSD